MYIHTVDKERSDTRGATTLGSTPTFTHAYIFIHMYMYTRTHIQINTQIYTHIRMQGGGHRYIWHTWGRHTWVDTNINVLIHIYTYVHVYTCTHTYIYTDIHIHTRWTPINLTHVGLQHLCRHRHTHTYTYWNVRTFIHIYTCHIYTQIYTYIHMQGGGHR